MKKVASIFVIYCVLLFAILIINAVSVSLFVIVPIFDSSSSGLAPMQTPTDYIFFIPIAGEANKATYAYSAAIAVAGSTIGAGYAIAHVGTSAISAITEKEENFGKAFLIVSLAEALAIYGLIMGILLWTKI